jgi:GntR family transcriptional regulator, carbon starvation induced regulator
MSIMARGDSAEESGADTLSERAATLVERDIIAGYLVPGARLGIVELIQR